MEIKISELCNAINEASYSSDTFDAQGIVSQIEFLKEILESVRDEREEVSATKRYEYPGHSKAIDGLLNILSLMESKLTSKG